MTTVAWDGKTLAADTLAAWTYNMYDMPKIHKVKKDLVGFSGSLEAGHLFLEWWKAGGGADKPSIADDFSGIIVKVDKVYWVENNLIPIELRQATYAIGSGAPFAITAMYFGKSAVQAVETAIYFDNLSGGKVVSMTR